MIKYIILISALFFYSCHNNDYKQCENNIFSYNEEVYINSNFYRNEHAVVKDYYTSYNSEQQCMNGRIYVVQLDDHTTTKVYSNYLTRAIK